MLHIARGNRTRLYDIHFRKPRPLVPLADIVEVGGRLDAAGAEVEPLDEDAIRAAARRARADGFGAIAVAFLFSYVNPEHELQAEAILRSELDGATVSLSHRIAREWREYERTSSAVIDAYTAPVVRRYLERLESELRHRGLPVLLHVMQSSGGIVTAESARELTLQTLLSGPVGGTMGGVALARLLGRRNLICVDMGGTSFDVSLVVDGAPDVSSEAELEGFPLMMPVVDIHTIGAGGGSLAYAEAGGLRVGPESAGADPGPACYGRGGTRPTVTDANLVLGRVDERSFAGGSMTLDVEAARTAIAGLGGELGPRGDRAGRGHLRRGQRQDGAGDPYADRREGDRAARLRARGVRRRGPDARRLPRARAGDRRGARAALPRRVLGVGDAGDRGSQGHEPRLLRAARPRSTATSSPRCSPSTSRTGSRASPTRASRRPRGASSTRSTSATAARSTR